MLKFSFYLTKKCSIQIHRNNHQKIFRHFKFWFSNSPPVSSNFLIKRQAKSTPSPNIKGNSKDNNNEEIINNFDTFETSSFFKTLLSFKQLEKDELMKVFVVEKQKYRGGVDLNVSQSKNENEESILRFADSYLKFLLIEYTQENFQNKTKIIIKGQNFLDEIRIYEKMTNMKKILPFFSLLFLMEVGAINYERKYQSILNVEKLVRILEMDKLLMDLLAFNYTNNIYDNILTRSTFLDRYFLLVSLGQDLELFKSVLKIMYELILFVNFNESLCGRIINSIIVQSNKDPSLIKENIPLIITIIDKLTTKLANVSDKIQVKLAYLISKHNFFGYNFKVTYNFWNKTKAKIGKEYSFLTAIEKKSILFSIGKTGFIDDGLINKIYLHEVKFMAELSKIRETDCQDVAKEKFINLIKSGTNLKIYNKEQINVFLNILLKDIKDLKIYYAISQHLIKSQFFHFQFWKEFFDNLDKKINETLQTSEFFEIFTTLRIFKFYELKILKYEGLDQKEFSEVLRLFKNASKITKVRNFIEQELGMDKEKEKKINSASSLLEWAIEKILIALAVQFEKEHKSKNKLKN